MLAKYSPSKTLPHENFLDCLCRSPCKSDGLQHAIEEAVGFRSEPLVEANLLVLVVLLNLFFLDRCSSRNLSKRTTSYSTIWSRQSRGETQCTCDISMQTSLAYAARQGLLEDHRACTCARGVPWAKLPTTYMCESAILLFQNINFV